MKDKMIEEFGEIMMNVYADRDSYSRAKIIDLANQAFIDVVNKNCSIPDIIKWVAFDFYKVETRPPQYGKYLITRKDGKIHWETWNGSGWAYNHNEIRYWAEIKPPCL